MSGKGEKRELSNKEYMACFPRRKPSILKKILLWPLDFIKALVNYNNGDIDLNSKGGNEGSYVSYSPPQSQTFRERHRIDPVDYANARIYYEGIDGKGDHCDHHEHDDD